LLKEWESLKFKFHALKRRFWSECESDYPMNKRKIFENEMKNKNKNRKMITS